MANPNPTPSPSTQFKKGVSNNPGGKTSKQRKLEVANAERATRIRQRMLTALEGTMNEDPTKETIVSDFIKSDYLRLLKESEDRGLGAPTIPVVSPDRSMGGGGLSKEDLDKELEKRGIPKTLLDE